MSIPGNSGYNWTVENATKIWLNCGPWAQFWTSSFSVPHESWRYNALYDHFWWTTLKNSATYFNINKVNLMILRHETCTVLTRWQCIYRCTVTRGFRLMNIQSTRGKVLTATAALISLLERCQSVNRQQSDFFWGGLSGAKMVMMVRHVNGGETCEQCFSTDKQNL